MQSRRYSGSAPLLADCAPARSRLSDSHERCRHAAEEAFSAGGFGLDKPETTRREIGTERRAGLTRPNPKCNPGSAKHSQSILRIVPQPVSRHTCRDTRRSRNDIARPLTVLRKVVLTGTKVPQTGSRFSSPLIGTEGGRPGGDGEAGASDRIISPIVRMIRPITMRTKADQEDDDNEIEKRAEHSSPERSLNTKTALPVITESALVSRTTTSSWRCEQVSSRPAPCTSFRLWSP